MALTEVESIYNLALGYIGEYEVEGGVTTSKQYTLCARFYPRARDEILTRHLWNEAMEQDIVINEDEPPLSNFNYKFAIPTDCLRIVSVHMPYDWHVFGEYILTNHASSPPTWSSSTNYYVAGQYVDYDGTTYLCDTSHEPSSAFADDSDKWTTQGNEYKILKIDYVKQLTDTTKWSELLKNAVALNLAAKVSVPITNDINVKNAMLNELERLVLPQARHVDAVQGTAKGYYYSQWLNSRFGGNT